MRKWLATSVFVVAISSIAVRAQEAPHRLSFEVAVVKRVDAMRRGAGPLRGGPGTNSPGRFNGTASMSVLITRAYDVKRYQISGPAWIDSERYEIDAKVPEGTSKEDLQQMLQALLAERFHLTAHRETKQLPVYVLQAARGGAKLTEARDGDTAAETKTVAPKITTRPDGFPEVAAAKALPRSYEIVIGGPDGVRYQLWARQESMQQLADRLSSQLDRPVIDGTRLAGRYDFSLVWARETAGGSIPRTDPPPDMIETHETPVISDAALNIFAALEKQLGLKLKPEKRPVKILIVDSADRNPAEN